MNKEQWRLEISINGLTDGQNGGASAGTAQSGYIVVTTVQNSATSTGYTTQGGESTNDGATTSGTSQTTTGDPSMVGQNSGTATRTITRYLTIGSKEAVGQSGSDTTSSSSVTKDNKTPTLADKSDTNKEGDTENEEEEDDDLGLNTVSGAFKV